MSDGDTADEALRAVDADVDDMDVALAERDILDAGRGLLARHPEETMVNSASRSVAT